MLVKSTYSYKNIWQIAYPIIIGNLAQDILTVVDTAFIGQLGEIPLAAAAIGSIFYLALVMLGWGFALGVQILIARKFGEKNYRDIQKIVSQSFILLAGLATVIFLIFRFEAYPFFKIILKSENVEIESLKFLDCRIYGIFAAFVNMNFRAFYIGMAKTKIISITTLIMAMVNFILDYLFIFGHGPFPEMGIRGAAIASVIAEYIALLIFIGYSNYERRAKILIKFPKLLFEKKWFTVIFKISTPTMLQHFISFSAWFIFFLLVEKMGETSLAISNIIRSIYLLMLVPIFGFASATNTLISFSIGNKEPNYIRTIIGRSLVMAFLSVGIIVIISFLFPQQILGLYSDNQAIINEALPVFYVIMAASFAITFGIIMFQAVAGTGKTHISLLIEITTLCFYIFGVYLLTQSENTMIEIVWMLEFVYGLGLGVISLFYLKNKYLKSKV